jgi:hypothetical protein
MDGQPKRLLPPSDGGQVPVEILGDRFPRIEAVGAVRRLVGHLAAYFRSNARNRAQLPVEADAPDGHNRVPSISAERPTKGTPMIARASLRIFAIVFAFAGSPALAAAQAIPAAQGVPATCAAQIEATFAEMDALGSQLNADVDAAVRTEFGKAALAAIRDRLSGNPAADALLNLENALERYQEYVAHLHETEALLGEAADCLRNPNSYTCLMRLLREENLQRATVEVQAAWERFFTSVVGEPVAEAFQRVETTQTLIHDRGIEPATALLRSATDGALRNCMAVFEQRANAGDPTPVDLGVPHSRPGASTATRILGGAALAGGIVAGTWYGVDYLQKKVEESGIGFGGSDDGGGGGGGGSSGTYRAVVTRSCTPAPGGLNPCAQSIAGGACSPVDFTFTVSNGMVSDCGWLNGSSVSGGSLTGRYRGSAENGVPVSGPIPGQVIGTAVEFGNTYRVTIAVTRAQ